MRGYEICWLNVLQLKKDLQRSINVSSCKLLSTLSAECSMDKENVDSQGKQLWAQWKTRAGDKCWLNSPAPTSQIRQLDLGKNGHEIICFATFVPSLPCFLPH